jgi:hypothetical protein
MMVNNRVLITIILISGLGVVAIPFGNPKFIGEAIIVELSFIILSVLIWSMNEQKAPAQTRIRLLIADIFFFS